MPLEQPANQIEASASSGDSEAASPASLPASQLASTESGQGARTPSIRDDPDHAPGSSELLSSSNAAHGTDNVPCSKRKASELQDGAPEAGKASGSVSAADGEDLNGIQPSASASHGVVSQSEDDAEGSASGAGEPSDAEMRTRIRATLQGADFTQISAKTVRVALEEVFKCNLAHRRALIRDEIAKCMEQKEAASTEAEPVEKPPSKKPKVVKLMALSPALAAFVGQEFMSRGDVTKRLWEYIKAEKLQDEKDKRRILIDEKLGTLFRGKSINMFRIATLLTKHCHNVEDLVDRP